MFCTGCGSKLKDDAKFCPNCGTKVDEQPVRAAQPQASPMPQQVQRAAMPNTDIVFDIDGQTIAESNNSHAGITRLIVGLISAVIAFAAIWNTKSPVVTSAVLSGAAVAVRILIGIVRGRGK